MQCSGKLSLCVLCFILIGPVHSTIGQPQNDVDVCRASKEPEMGIETCSRAIADSAASKSVRAELLLHRAWFYNRSRQRELAILDYAQALEVDPDNLQARRLRALAYANQDNWARALADYDELIRRGPDDPEGYQARGDVKIFQGEYEEAIRDYRKAIALHPKGRESSLLGCQVSASLTVAFFSCVGVAYDLTQPASARAQAQERLDTLRAQRPGGR
jgi:tetratricopeptide (TPR) repeat protein